jgi:transcriptional regulator with XRE-family HTH domain/quercetin dioxygenase-like cupin family protein
MEPEARAKLRQARQDAGLSLRQLGARIGVSASLLSQIERGNSEPSVASLYALVSELDVSLDSLLDRRGDSAKSAGDPATTSFTSPTSTVLRPGTRAVLNMTSGVRWEQLTRGPDPLVDALLVTYGPGSRSSSDGTLMTHSGVEYAYLLEGELVLQLGFETFQISAGDSLSFHSSRPHMYSNVSDRQARGIWFVAGRLEAAAEAFHGPAGIAPTSAVDVLRQFRGQAASGTHSSDGALRDRESKPRAAR